MKRVLKIAGIAIGSGMALMFGIWLLGFIRITTSEPQIISDETITLETDTIWQHTLAVNSRSEVNFEFFPRGGPEFDICIVEKVKYKQGTMPEHDCIYSNTLRQQYSQKLVLDAGEWLLLIDGKGWLTATTLRYRISSRLVL